MRRSVFEQQARGSGAVVLGVAGATPLVVWGAKPAEWSECANRFFVWCYTSRLVGLHTPMVAQQGKHSVSARYESKRLCRALRTAIRSPQVRSAEENEDEGWVTDDGDAEEEESEDAEQEESEEPVGDTVYAAAAPSLRAVIQGWPDVEDQAKASLMSWLAAPAQGFKLCKPPNAAFFGLLNQDLKDAGLATLCQQRLGHAHQP